MKSTILSFSILLVLLVASATSAQTQDVRSWSTAGSTGTADKNDLNKIVYSKGIVSFAEIATQSSAAPRLALPLQTVQAVIRYNVTAADGLFFSSTGKLCMSVRFRDDGNRARVLVRLMQFNLENGTDAELLRFDSDLVGTPQPGFQVNSVSRNQVAFDFSHNAYYVEATLTKQQPVSSTFGGGKPGLAVVVLTRCLQF